jgi:hypothetical protein
MNMPNLASFHHSRRSSFEENVCPKIKEQPDRQIIKRNNFFICQNLSGYKVLIKFLLNSFTASNMAIMFCGGTSGRIL